MTRTPRSTILPGLARSIVVLLAGLALAAAPVSAQSGAPAPSTSPAPAEAACDSADDLRFVVDFIGDSLESDAGLVPVAIGTIAAVAEARRLVGLIGETYRPLADDLVSTLQELRATLGDLEELDTAGARLAAIGGSVEDVGQALDALTIQLRTRCPAP